MSSLLAVDRYRSRESILTDASIPDSLFSKLSEAESSTTEPPQTGTNKLAQSSHSKGGLSEILSRPAPDPARELKIPSRVVFAFR